MAQKLFIPPPGLSVKDHAYWLKTFGPKPKVKPKPKVRAKPKRKVKPKPKRKVKAKPALSFPSNSGSKPKFLSPPKGWQPYKSPDNIAKQKALVAATAAFRRSVNRAWTRAWAKYRAKCDQIMAQDTKKQEHNTCEQPSP